MAEEASKAIDSDIEFAHILSDLKILSQSCKRDIKNSNPWNVEGRRNDFNQIVRRLEQIRPNKYHDISEIKADPHVLYEIAQESPSHRTYSCLDTIETEASKLLGRLNVEKPRAVEKSGALTILERLCNRFDYVARQLRIRHNSRQTLDVKDEYDVQDLMHALLRINFDDIRPEEYTPSYAGCSSRIDFLLKTEQIVMEVKRATNKLRDRKIANELTNDIAWYKNHPDCKILVCFVYDPDKNIRNLKGFQDDLEKQSDIKLLVKVFVYPK